MKALTLTQPWASLCVLTNSTGEAAKQFETRGWKPSDKMLKVIGDEPIAIHAAQGFPKAARNTATTNLYFSQALFQEHFAHVDQLPRGVIVGTVELYRFVQTENIRNDISAKEREFGDYRNNRWAWQFLYPKLLHLPIPCKGALSLWTVPEEIEAEILRQTAI